MPRRRKTRAAGDVVYIDPYVQPPGFGYGGMSPWQEFVHQHAHLGYSPSQLGEMYERQMYGRGYGPTAWNRFVESHANQGMSPHQMGVAYEKTKKKASGRRGRGAMVAGFHDWQKFLHEYGGRGMTREELVQLYHQLHPK